jgi:hypothetical protein
MVLWEAARLTYVTRLASPLRHEPSTLLTLSPFVCRVFRLSRSVASGMSGVEHVEAEHK